MIIGLVTCARVPDLEPCERIIIPLFNAYGFRTQIVIWDNPHVQWASYDCLIIRSIWDYHLKFELFKKWLDQLEILGVSVLNPISILRDNSHKLYLKNLAENGIPVVPTLFLKKERYFDFKILEERKWQQVIIKPAVSASAYRTGLYSINDQNKIEIAIKEIQKESDVLIQQFMPEIRKSGELSIIFFNKKYAYAVLKEAAGDEFRIQSEFGGSNRLVEISKRTIDAAEKILSHYNEDILYARVDGLVIEDEFVLMELELTEPSLFFELNDEGPGKFVEEVVRLMEMRKGNLG